MIIYVDIDHTICYYSGELNYPEAKPNYIRIDKINKLFDDGHTVVYWTARGTGTGIDWTELTHSQLNEWNCKYNEIKLGKPYYDLFIDDKNINSETFFEEGCEVDGSHI